MSQSAENRSAEIAFFGGGCFWCTEAVFQRLAGVTSVTSGYSGGSVAHPTYEQVSSATTGHAEVIRIEFDPRVISYPELLDIFFATHDPTTADRQGSDIGPQYRSIILYTSPVQEKQARVRMQPGFKTQIIPFNNFYPAEDYHQDYYNSHRGQAYCRLVIDPKVRKLLDKFSPLVDPDRI